MFFKKSPHSVLCPIRRISISFRRKEEELKYESVWQKGCVVKFLRRRWCGYGPGWSATRSAPRTPPGPPRTGRGWSRGRRSAAPLRPCAPPCRPRLLWRARAPARRWRRRVAESWTQRITRVKKHVLLRFHRKDLSLKAAWFCCLCSWISLNDLPPFF